MAFLLIQVKREAVNGDFSTVRPDQHPCALAADAVTQMIRLGAAVHLRAFGHEQLPAPEYVARHQRNDGRIEGGRIDGIDELARDEPAGGEREAGGWRRGRVGDREMNGRQHRRRRIAPRQTFRARSRRFEIGVGANSLAGSGLDPRRHFHDELGPLASAHRDDGGERRHHDSCETTERRSGEALDPGAERVHVASASGWKRPSVTAG